MKIFSFMYQKNNKKNSGNISHLKKSIINQSIIAVLKVLELMVSVDF